MPRRLPERCVPDSIREFRAASLQRSIDATTLADAGRGTAAIYLWGYCAEMTLKAAYFRLLGFSRGQNIGILDLNNAKRAAADVGVTWPKTQNLHAVSLWAQLLVSTRASKLNWSYHDQLFGSRVLSSGLSIGMIWRETLRYHKNIAYAHELSQVRSASQWLMKNFRLL